MIYQGDCLEVLKTFEPDSIDALVTDPPAGISFMQKEFDTFKSSIQFIASMESIFLDCLRVMKPGAHGFVWALPRTSHWTATALERAGFEIRDVVTHLFGSGFPKSMDISKAIDKQAGAEREILGLKHDAEKRSRKHVSIEWDRPSLHDSEAILRSKQLTAPSTDAAKRWAGWGTALKPASEHWILVRKPISEKTVAANMLKHGTGGINVDASRIGTEDKLGRTQGTMPQPMDWGNKSKSDVVFVSEGHSQGRFPANLILDEEAAQMLDEQSGLCKVGGVGMQKADGFNPGKNHTGKSRGLVGNHRQDNGSGASRFFYCAKTSKSERGEGNTHPTVKPKKLMSYLIKLITPPGGIVLDPFMGSGSTGIACAENGFQFIGIEKEKEYVKIAERRIDHSSQQARFAI